MLQTLIVYLDVRTEFTVSDDWLIIKVVNIGKDMSWGTNA